jgi:hypothetical protein
MAISWFKHDISHIDEDECEVGYMQFVAEVTAELGDM